MEEQGKGGYGRHRARAGVQELHPTEARQGVALGHMRYVLGISVALILTAFAVLYFMYF